MSHFLKRLELNGFKSFANRTVLEFPAGIVAVVGPNGSGKSNIVDAVRWLLGERDAKNLRGGKGEDLIFAGTEKRARIGMASASLHFENKNRFFPVDFEEVVVTRQISRSGENKYFLNKSEILLRDLIDFFAKARLGARGLIIIGQGDSDLFIRSTPMERREMIEEILGLREYQIKRADAERRLKNTRINLEKTQALVEEILPHLRSLKRQTNRWEKRGELAEELTVLENHFFGFQLAEIAERSKAVDATIAGNHAQFEVLEKERRTAEARQAEVESSQPEEKKSLAKIKDEIRLLFEKRSGIEKDLGRLEAQIEMAHANRSAANGSNNDQAEKLLGLVQKIRGELTRALDEDELELRALVEGLVEEIDLTLQEKSERKSATVPTSLREDLKKMTATLAELEKQIAAFRKKERSLEEGQEGFYQIFKSAVASVQAAKNRIGEWENRNREHQLEKERLDLRREELFRQIEQAGRKPEEFKAGAKGESPIANRDMHASELSELERKIFRLRGDLASIGEIDQALVKEATDTESRYAFLSKESEDLLKAVADLTGLMRELSEKIKTEFDKSLGSINREFEKFFGLMFGGGTAKLKVAKRLALGAGRDESEGNSSEKADDEIVEREIEEGGGVEIDVRLPRKKIASLDALSGGERSLVGIAALFAMVSVSPPPFLMLDEIDAPLDERNARRFSDMLREFSKRTQFIVVTHNRATMEAAEILYGVTLAEDGTSKVVSLKFEE